MCMDSSLPTGQASESKVIDSEVYCVLPSNKKGFCMARKQDREYQEKWQHLCSKGKCQTAGE